MRILIADDHAIMREGLRELLDAKPDYMVVGEAHTGRQAIKMCEQLPVDLVIMDISMPECNGIDATRIIKKKYGNIKVIILSVHSEKNIVKEALSAGTDGYLPKNCAFKEINAAITATCDGQTYLSPQIATALVADFITPHSTSKNKNKDVLSVRERNVLQAIAEGKRSKEIAAELNTGVRTIERARTIIMDKLELRTVADLTKYAIRQGLTTLDS